MVYPASGLFDTGGRGRGSEIIDFEGAYEGGAAGGGSSCGVFGAGAGGSDETGVILLNTVMYRRGFQCKETISRYRRTVPVLESF